MYNYIGYLKKPSLIKTTIKCKFFDLEEETCIISKGSIIEFYQIHEDQLKHICYMNIFANIIFLHSFPFSVTKDYVFILNEDLDWSIIKYEDNVIKTIKNGSIKEEIGRQSDLFYAIHEDYILFSAYSNILKVVFLKVNEEGKESVFKDFSFRYDYDELLSIRRIFLNSSNLNGSPNVFAILKFESLAVPISSLENEKKNQNSRVQYKEPSISLDLFGFSCFSNGKYMKTPWNITSGINSHLSLSSNPNVSLIFSPEIGGLLIFDSSKVSYYHVNQLKPTSFDCNIQISKQIYSVQYINKVFINYTQLDKSRYLVYDNKYNIFMLGFNSNKSFILQLISDMSITQIGDISSIVSFGDENIFICSSDSSSKYMKLVSDFTSSSVIQIESISSVSSVSSVALNSFLYKLKLLNDFPSLSPISDFTIQNNDNRNKLICISGTNNNCSLRTVMRGVSLNSLLTIDISNIKNIFFIEYIDTLLNKKYLLMYINKVYSYHILKIYENSNLNEEANYEIDEFDNKFSVLYTILQKETIINMESSGIDNIIITDKGLYNIDNNLLKINNQYKIEVTSSKIYSNGILIYSNMNSLYYFSLDLLFHKKLLENIDISTYELVDISETLIIFTYFNIYSNQLIARKINNSNLNYEESVLYELNQLSNYSIDYINNLVFICFNSIIEDYFLFCSTNFGLMLIFKLKKSDYSFIFNNKIQFSNGNPYFIKNICIDSKQQIFLSTDQPLTIHIHNEFPLITPINTQNMINLYTPKGVFDKIKVFHYKNNIVFGDFNNFQLQNTVGKKIIGQLYLIEYLKNEDLFVVLGENENSGFVRVYDSNHSQLAEYIFENIYEISQSLGIIYESDLKKGISDSIEKEKNVLLLGKNRETKENNSDTLNTLLMDVDINNNSNGILSFDSNNHSIYLLIGTKIIKNKSDYLSSENRGRLLLIQLSISKITSNISFHLVDDMYLEGPISKVVINNEGTIFASSNSTLYIFELGIFSNSHLKIKKITDYKSFNFICDLSLNGGPDADSVIVSDIYKSLSIYKYIKLKHSLIEQSRDYSPLWITSSLFYNINKDNQKQFILSSDVNNNLIVYRQNLKPRSDDEKMKLERVCYMNIGSQVNRFKVLSKKIDVSEMRTKFTSMEGLVNYSYFSCINGAIGVIIELNKKDFEYLFLLCKSIIKRIYYIGNFDYNTFRSFKDGFIYEEMNGFVEGAVLEEFLIMNDTLKKEVIEDMRYPWSRSVEQTVIMIEMLRGFH